MLTSKDFFNYAKNSNKVANINDLFSNWATENKLSLEKAQTIYNKVTAQIEDMFMDKKAIKVQLSDGNIIEDPDPEKIKQTIQFLKQNVDPNIQSQVIENNSPQTEQLQTNQNLEPTMEQPQEFPSASEFAEQQIPPNNSEMGGLNEDNINLDLGKAANNSTEEINNEEINTEEEDIYPLFDILKAASRNY